MAELTQFGRDIWVVDGPDARDMGLLFTTRMTIVRLSNDTVWVESPVSLPAEILDQIREIGPVEYVVASTQRHIWRLNAWHDLFPNAQLWAPVGARLALGDLSAPIHDVYIDTPPLGWAQDIDQLAFKGSSLLKEVMFFHKPSHTLIVGDLVQANPMLKGRPFRNVIFKLMGAAYPNGGVGLDLRLSFRDKALARQSMERMMSWDFDRLIIAHGPCVESKAKSFLRDAFKWLLK